MSRHYAKLFTALLAAAFIALVGGALAGSYDDAMTAYDNGDYATALKLLRPMAERGDTNAQYSIGRMYVKGQGVPKDDAEAVKWFRKANEQSKALKAYNSGDFALAFKTFQPLAAQGQVMAAYILGLMYANGQGVTENYVEALKWLQKAAEQGEAKAQFSVGVIYSKGFGVPQNYAEAFKWYRRSADQGYAIAQYNLGAMYAKGEAVTADVVTAHMLYSLAAQHGVKAAAEAKDGLAKSMTAAQIAEAETKAHDWKPKFEVE
jgi:TPR repeat protein